MFLNVLSSAGGAASGFSSIFFLIILFVVFYFFMIRPENKRKKQLNEMRDHTAVGDEIVTIGGIMGKVVQVTGDTITFETGEDQVGHLHQCPRGEAARRRPGRRPQRPRQQEEGQDLRRGKQHR